MSWLRCFRVGRTAFFFFESYCGLLRHGAVYRFLGACTV